MNNIHREKKSIHTDPPTVNNYITGRKKKVDFRRWTTAGSELCPDRRQASDVSPAAPGLRPGCPGLVRGTGSGHSKTGRFTGWKRQGLERRQLGGRD